MSRQKRNGYEYDEAGDPIVNLGLIGDEPITADILLDAICAIPPLSALPSVRLPIVPSKTRKSKKWLYEDILAVSHCQNCTVSCFYCGVMLINDEIKEDLHRWWYEFGPLELELSECFIEQVRCRENNNKSPYCCSAFNCSTEWYDKFTKPLTVDHDLSVHRGGSDDYDNLFLCCHSCNCKKGILTATEYLNGVSQAEIRSIIDGIIALNSVSANDCLFDEDDESLQAKTWRSVNMETPE